MANHSRDPREALQAAMAAGYTAVHIEQAVPVLDRDLNLAADLSGARARELVTQLLGDNFVSGPDAFKLGPEGGGVMLGAPGWAVVGGQIIRICAPVRYEGQLDAGSEASLLQHLLKETEDPALAQGIFRRLQGWSAHVAQQGAQPASWQTARYWLDVWTEQITDAIDPSLGHPEDLGLRTATRTRPVWLLRRVVDKEIPTPPAGHSYLALGAVVYNRYAPSFDTAMSVFDQRKRGLSFGGPVVGGPGGHCVYFAASTVDPPSIGDVVKSDANKRVWRSSADKSTSVVGVVASTCQPDPTGKREAGVAVTIAGRVQCKVNGDGGKVQVGTLLVAGDNGVARAAGDKPTPGTILGKALEALDADGPSVQLLEILVTLG